MNVENLVPEEFRWPVAVDHDSIVKVINSVYKQVNLPEPRIVWFDSVYAAEFAFQIIHDDHPGDILDHYSNPQSLFVDRFFGINLSNNWEHTEVPRKIVSEWCRTQRPVLTTVKRNFMEFLQNDITGVTGISHDEKRWLKDSILPLMYITRGLHCAPKPLHANIVFGIEFIVEQLNFINRSCFCWYPLDELVMLVKFPLKFKVNQQGYLHCDDGPATIWPDGSRTWHLNGTLVPSWVVETSVDDIEPWEIISADWWVRSEAIKKIGIARLIEIFDASVMDKRKHYELLKLKINIPDYNDLDIYIDFENLELPEEQIYLLMLNPSTGEYPIEGVHPDCQTVSEALSWRNSTNDIPSVIT